MSEVAFCLWFAREAEEAARLYVSLVPDSRIERVQRAPADHPGGREGDAVVVEFTLAGARLSAINGGEAASYSHAASLRVLCEDQDEVDRLWAALGAGGRPERCGWLRDRWGVPWQIVPRALPELLADPDPARARRVMEAMLGMTKLDVAGLRAAAEGGGAA